MSLSGCSDQIILEEILKKSRNPGFEQIVQLGTNLKVSRTIVEKLPGTKAKGQSQKQNQLLKLSNKKDYAVDEPERHLKDYKKQKLKFFKKEGICHKCGNEGEHSCKVRSDTQCFKCSHFGHYGRMCLNFYSSSSSDTSEAENDRESSQSSDSERNQNDDHEN